MFDYVSDICETGNMDKHEHAGNMIRHEHVCVCYICRNTYSVTQMVHT